MQATFNGVKSEAKREISGARRELENCYWMSSQQCCNRGRFCRNEVDFNVCKNKRILQTASSAFGCSSGKA
jgi:hypothetical protein